MKQLRNWLGIRLVYRRLLQSSHHMIILNALQDDKISLDFVVAAANLRAFNYRIAMKSRFDIKCKRRKVPKFAVISTLSSFLL